MERKFLVGRISKLDLGSEKIVVQWYSPERPRKLADTGWVPVVDRGKPHTDAVVFEAVWFQFREFRSSNGSLPDDAIAFLRDEKLL